MKFIGEKERRSFEEVFDWVIVGSGAAGATAARVLSETGASVAVLEEGPCVDTKEFNDLAFPSIRRMFRDAGSQVARGRAFIPVIQGRCLGGSTVVNSAIVWRLPDDVWAPWRDEYRLGDALSLPELHKQWDQLEDELHAKPTPPEVWGEFNRLMDVAKDKLKVGAAPTTRYARNCKGSGRCLTGCPHGAKQSMLVSYLPYAEERGAALLTAAKVERVRLEGGRATAVEGDFRDPATGRALGHFRVAARKGVIVAASAIQSPMLLARSGVRSPHLGKHFQAHPGAPMMGVFDQRVDMWQGATQGYDADHYRKDGRIKIETIALPPEIVFARAAGVGSRYLENMAAAPHSVIWAVQMRAHAKGTVRESFLGADVRFDLEPRDMVNLKKGLKFSAELMFAAGAREVITGIHGFRERLKSADELPLLDGAPDDPSCYSFIMSHLFGTARMSQRERDGVVGTDFAVHGTQNLFVVDSSVFPTNIGVNPQHTIIAVAMLATKRLAERRAP